MPIAPQIESKPDYQLHQAWQDWKKQNSETLSSLVEKVLAGPQDAIPVTKIARILYKALRKNGYDRGEIVSLATELIELLTAELRQKSAKAPHS